MTESYQDQWDRVNQPYEFQDRLEARAMAEEKASLQPVLHEIGRCVKCGHPIMVIYDKDGGMLVKGTLVRKEETGDIIKWEGECHECSE